MSRFSSRFVQNFQRFLIRDQEGAVLPLFGIMVIMMVVIAGIAVDVSRSVNAREKLSYALDAAALSVAADLSTSIMSDDEIKTALEDSFRANLSSAEFLDEAIENLSFDVDPDNGLITVDSSATLNNYFIDIGGYMKSALGPETFSFGTSSQVAYSRYDVELTLVVDVTGSMSGHINDLKNASESVVDILIPEGTTDGKVKISIVPYSVGVNLGSYASTATGGLSTRCSTERDGSNKYTDVSYNVEPMGDGSGTYRSQDCSDSEIQPLTDNRNTLLSSISALETDGYTAGQTGIGWGWYTLSPNWNNLFTGNSAPADYSDTETLKFALIMTDGDFNTYYDLETLTKKQCKKKKNKGEYNGSCKKGKNDYWIEKSGWGYWGESSQRAISLCDAMKTKDIQMYTVYFGSNNNSDGAKVMKACADSGNYYQASSSSALVGAFANIAKKIQQIYISQ
ncbi:TadE/TadG family type IV pilus assembly protein [Roseibium sp.]|uniref:TadE/TadG family type IV pilus assembly protein n=1 Tax=Roseibium sp. TaxID=1936156 RepID=UPI0039F0CEE2